MEERTSYNTDTRKLYTTDKRDLYISDTLMLHNLKIPTNTTASRGTTQNRSHFSRAGLDCHVTVDRMKNALRLCSSAYGTNGHVLLLRNSVERGHVLVTCCSRRIFGFLRASEPLLRLMFSALEQRGRSAPDHGLLCAIVCVRLSLAPTHLLNSVNTPSTNPQIAGTQTVGQRVSELLGDLCEQLVSWLSVCPLRVSVDGSSIAPLLSVCRTVISPVRRSACIQDVEAIVRTVVQAFVHSLPSESRLSSTEIATVCIEDTEGSARAEFVSGLLLDTAGCSVSDIRLLKQHLPLVTCLLVTCSMSGDTNELYDVTLQSTSAGDDAVTYSACERLVRATAERLVTLLLCQKVVHAGIKRLAVRLGVTVIDRLGTAVVERLCACRVTPVTSLSSVNTASDLSDSQLLRTSGKLTRYKQRVHVQLHVNVVSLVLYAPTDESLLELQDVCERAVEALRLTLRDEWALCGAGCWQAAAASYLHQFKRCEWSDSIAQYMSRVLLELSHSDISGCDVNSAYSQSSSDGTCVRSGHVFSSGSHACCCGGLQKSVCHSAGQASVCLPPQQLAQFLDCADSVISALRCACNTASILLNIGSVLVENA